MWPSVMAVPFTVATTVSALGAASCAHAAPPKASAIPAPSHACFIRSPTSDRAARPRSVDLTCVAPYIAPIAQDRGHSRLRPLLGKAFGAGKPNGSHDPVRDFPPRTPER